jgi:hypothetical protein
MTSPEHVTLRFTNQRIPFDLAEEAGKKAYKYFIDDDKPQLNPLTLLSHSIRRYDDNVTFTAGMRAKLTESGFLLHGERTPLKRRLKLPGIVAVSLVVPDLEHGKVVGEYLEEPFEELPRLDEWYISLTDVGTKLSWLE